jgi:4-diphosphocytidyl-2-C-methyl-D-erythritol kinase
VMSLTRPSFAKINWTLEVLGRRPDGYHELRTILQTIDLADTLHFRLREAGTILTCDHPGVPLGEENLVFRAATLLREAVGCDQGVEIAIEKRLPMGGGLGGGSSNAAVTLLALQELWGVALPTSDLFRLASRLGADVPFFLLGGTCLGVGRGDEVYPLPELEATTLLLVNVGISVQTPEVYRNLPPELTKAGPVDMMPLSLDLVYHRELLLSDWRTDPIGSIARRMINDLERPVFPRHPQLREIKQTLSECGARSALLSGSGSTVFAIFDNDQIREEALRHCQSLGWGATRARTLTRSDYRRALSPVPPQEGLLPA